MSRCMIWKVVSMEENESCEAMRRGQREQSGERMEAEGSRRRAKRLEQRPQDPMSVHVSEASEHHSGPRLSMARDISPLGRRTVGGKSA